MAPRTRLDHRLPPGDRSGGTALARLQRPGRGDPGPHRPALRPRDVGPADRRPEAAAARVQPRGRLAAQRRQRRGGPEADRRGDRERAARRGARPRRHQRDDRRRARRGGRRRCRCSTSRRGCAATATTCPRSATGSRPTASRDLLFAPCEHAREVLVDEGVAGTVHVTGDVLADVLLASREPPRRERRERRLRACHRAPQLQHRRARAPRGGARLPRPRPIAG